MNRLYIYAPTTSSRLVYICNFICKELIHVDFSIINDKEEFQNYNGIKINYSNEVINSEYFTIGNIGLLFEKNITSQKIECFETNQYKAFFKTIDSDFPFDIFSASFYLLSRYEEYLPHTKDEYGRYAHTNSLAFKENFLSLPLINIWVKDFAAQIKNKFSLFTFHFSPFTFTPTYDIDIAFSYKYKGLTRNIGGFFKAPSLNRIMVLLGLKKDPFDTYGWLNKLHKKYHLKAHYFFLVANRNKAYDKNILPHKKQMGRLIKSHAEYYSIGIHPSWQSGDDFNLLKKEKQCLEEITKFSVTSSRQHYIRFNLPEGYRKLLIAGITDDFSMGYGSINGFRASVASSFYWYDLEKEEQKNLRIHPFCFMEANSYYEQNFTPDIAYKEMLHYYNACKNISGQMITIWHNNFFGNDKEFVGWKEIYEQFIAQVQQ
ncbi:MAG: polysaccharide deacetylase family protein [Chitinophagaceae bacterium]|nr:polysaccharide deacetylase family protein [Chitinophagaceae bacterium]